MADDVAQLDKLTRDLLNLAKGFDGPAKNRVLIATVKSWPDAIDSAVKADLGGDLNMSGWGVNLLPEIDIDRDHATFEPTKRSRGPWKVAQQGRNVGKSSSDPRRLTGRGRNRRQRRWNGYTRGKGTFDDAVTSVKRESVKAMNKAIVKEVGGVFR